MEMQLKEELIRLSQRSTNTQEEAEEPTKEKDLDVEVVLGIN